MQRGKKFHPQPLKIDIFTCVTHTVKSEYQVGNVAKDGMGTQLVVNTRMELCGAFINRMNVTYVNYTVKDEANDEKGR